MNELSKIFKETKITKIGNDCYKVDIEKTISCIIKKDTIYFDNIYSSKDLFDKKFKQESKTLTKKSNQLRIKKEALFKCYTNIIWYFIYMKNHGGIIRGILNYEKEHDDIYIEIEKIIREKSRIDAELDVFPQYLDYFYDCRKSIVDFLIEIGYNVKFSDFNVRVFDIIKEVAEM